MYAFESHCVDTTYYLQVTKRRRNKICSAMGWKAVSGGGRGARKGTEWMYGRGEQFVSRTSIYPKFGWCIVVLMPEWELLGYCVLLLEGLVVIRSLARM